MPRCGSTLLESILSLNPEVQDLGEVSFLEESLDKTDDLIEVENLYAEKVKLINSEKKIFTDKNLFNFLYCPVGLVNFCIKGPKTLITWEERFGSNKTREDIQKLSVLNALDRLRLSIIMDN